MKANPFICAVIVAAMMPAAALADDPHDVTMRSAAARAHDREVTRQLNLRESAKVRQRDARLAQARRAARVDSSAAEDNERAMANYARDRAQYEREMAAWRRTVAACRAGDYSACDN
jgi:hypothetical protein